MASSSSSSTMSPVISQEEFFAFHNIDRQLFCKVVFNLKRDPAEAMQASALWLWLERLNMAQYVATLLRFPDSIFEAVYEETLLCLKVAESEEDTLYINDIPMVQTIVGKDRNGVNLKFFHENRINVLLGVGNIIQQICLRAFQDLIQFLMNYREQLKQYHEYYPPLPNASRFGVIGGSRGGSGSGSGAGAGASAGGQIDGSRAAPQPQLRFIYEQNFRDQGIFVDNPSQIRVGDFSVPLKGQYNMNANNDSLQRGGSSHSSNIYMPQINTYGVDTQSQALERDLIEILAQMRLGGNPMPHMGEERQNTLPSDRTIFLTFSKGYPILENELREFLTRSFGDVVETLYMQEVGENEQSLYARLVVRDLRAMEVILSKHGRSKFSINGKHVWARKYVRKNPNSPPSSPIDMPK